jgi:hypothetical protein
MQNLVRDQHLRLQLFPLHLQLSISKPFSSPHPILLAMLAIDLGDGHFGSA